MAQARRIPVPVPEPPKKGVQLDLSYAEAATLGNILNSVGGDHDKSPRGYADAINDALKTAGIGWPDADKIKHLVKGSIYYSNGDPFVA